MEICPDLTAYLFQSVEITDTDFQRAFTTLFKRIWLKNPWDKYEEVQSQVKSLFSLATYRLL